jgi:hypothetical protein
VIDEVHAFAGDDRGWHVLALLERIRAISGCMDQARGARKGWRFMKREVRRKLSDRTIASGLTEIKACSWRILQCFSTAGAELPFLGEAGCARAAWPRHSGLDTVEKTRGHGGCLRHRGEGAARLRGGAPTRPAQPAFSLGWVAHGGLPRRLGQAAR